MKSLLIFAKSNLKKTKAQSAAIFLLLFITSMLFSLCLLISFGYSDSFEELHTKENGSHNNVIVAGLKSEIDKFENDYIKVNDKINEYDITDISLMDGEIKYGDNIYKTVTIGMDLDDCLNKKVGRFVIDEISNESGVYLPCEFNASGNYNVGDDFIFYQNNEEKINCKIVGFYQDTMISGIQGKIVTYLFTSDIYKDKIKLLYTNSIYKYSLMSFILNDENDAKMFEFDTTNEIKSNYKFIKVIESNNKLLTKSSRYATQIIASAVLGVAAFIFALVSVLLMISNISFFIQTNIKNYGMLKAIGYNSKKLRLVLLIQFLIIGSISIILGVSISYIVFPHLNNALESLSGIKHEVKFSFLKAISVVLILLVIVSISTIIASTKIKELTPLNAIRNNLGNKNTKNYIPIESCKVGIDFNIALKNACLNIKQSIVIFFTMLGISLGIVFSILMYQNVVANPIPMIELTSQIGDIQVDIDKEKETDLINYLDGNDKIENFVLYKRYSRVLINNSDPLNSVIIGNKENFINESFCYKGDYPKDANEICLGGLYASKNNIKIGDSIKCKIGNKEFEYIVSGLVQNAGDEGETILFNKEGYEKLEELDSLSYLITLEDESTKESVIDDIKNNINGSIVNDYKSIVNSTVQPFMDLMAVIIIGVITICISLIAFVLYNLVRTMLFKKQMEYSIMKAIGYSTSRLMMQTAMSFIPVVFITLLICLPIACISINPIFTIFVRNVGIVNSMFKFSYLYVAIAGVIVLLLSFIFVYLLSIRIKKNSPKQLLG